MVSSAEHATHNGGCGFCIGLGTTLRSGKSNRSRVFAAALLEHRDDRAHRIFPDRAFFVEAAVERFEFGDAGTFAHAEFDAAAAHQIECRNALGDARRVHRRQLHDAVREADLPGALAGRGEKHFRGRRVRIFLEEVMLHFPGEVVAQSVRPVRADRVRYDRGSARCLVPRAAAIAARKICRISFLSPRVTRPSRWRGAGNCSRTP